MQYLSDGRIRVKSPYTRQTSAACGGGSTSASVVAGPANGVIYVQDVPADPADPNHSAAALACGTAQPIGEYTAGTGDPYSCRDGDAFVHGTVKGRHTLASAHNIVVVDNLTYAQGLAGRDVMGLVAQNNVEVYHPRNESTRLEDVRIDAAIASVQNSFTVQNYNVGAPLGDLTVNGVIVQKFRGPVGQGNGSNVTTGYGKAYNYDPRLLVLPPPSFLELQNDAWQPSGFSEQNAQAG